MYFHCYSWLGVLIYWLFLFIVVVVLLNILIAQFSKSYEEETERAHINVILTRTKIILKMEQSFLSLGSRPSPYVRVFDLPTPAQLKRARNS